jgi:hypothetical protein
MTLARHTGAFLALSDVASFAARLSIVHQFRFCTALG